MAGRPKRRWDDESADEISKTLKPLYDRLDVIGARFVNEWDGPAHSTLKGQPASIFKMYTTGRHSYLIQIHADFGWEVFTSVSDSLRIEDTLKAIV